MSVTRMIAKFKIKTECLVYVVLFQNICKNKNVTALNPCWVGKHGSDSNKFIIRRTVDVCLPQSSLLFIYVWFVVGLQTIHYFERSNICVWTMCDKDAIDQISPDSLFDM